MKRDFLVTGVVGLLALICSPLAPAATITVTGVGDSIQVDGFVTLREAIMSANMNSDVNADVTAQNPGAYGADFINFNFAGTGVHTINLVSALPTITGPVIINGYSQGVAPNNAKPNTQANTDDAVLLVQITALLLPIQMKPPSLRHYPLGNSPPSWPARTAAAA